MNGENGADNEGYVNLLLIKFFKTLGGHGDKNFIENLCFICKTSIYIIAWPNDEVLDNNGLKVVESLCLKRRNPLTDCSDILLKLFTHL